MTLSGNSARLIRKENPMSALATPYPQAKPFTAKEAEVFLAQPLIAKLASHNADGTIHLTSLWFN